MTMSKAAILPTLAKCIVLPILVTDDVDQAIRCVQILAGNGLPAVEITLRTPNAMNVLRRSGESLPGSDSGRRHHFDASAIGCSA